MPKPGATYALPDGTDVDAVQLNAVSLQDDGSHLLILQWVLLGRTLSYRMASNGVFSLVYGDATMPSTLTLDDLTFVREYTSNDEDKASAKLMALREGPYRLPNGTVVEAFYMSNGSWRFDDATGQPLFAYTNQCQLKRLEYHTNDVFRLVECNLDLEDLTRIE